MSAFVPLPAEITYEVCEIGDSSTLESFKVKGGSALFLCRITKADGVIVDFKPLAAFNLDSEGRRFANEFLKQEKRV